MQPFERFGDGNGQSVYFASAPIYFILLGLPLQSLIQSILVIIYFTYICTVSGVLTFIFRREFLTVKRSDLYYFFDVSLIIFKDDKRCQRKPFCPSTGFDQVTLNFFVKKLNEMCFAKVPIWTFRAIKFFIGSEYHFSQ